MTDSPVQTPLAVARIPNTRRYMLRRVAINTYIALVGAYGLNTTLYLVLRAIVGERWGLIGLFNSFFHLLILPAVILLPLSLLLRRRWLVIELIAPFLFFISNYGGQFLPRNINVPAEAPRLNLLSFNINKDNQHTDDVIRIVRESNADVVAIQELSTWVADGFNTQLATLYPYRALHPQADFSGQGILSRYPLSADEYWQINLGHQSLQMDWNGQPVAFFNVHPIHPLRGIQFDGQSRAEEIDEMLRRASTVSDPVLIAGDFNMTNLSDDYGRVTEHYDDTYQQVGWGMGFGFPNFDYAFHIKYLPPIARIDYIFHNDHFQAVSMRVGTDSGGSDHFPVYATFALAGGSG
ncbi:MAG: endonuclease/exonuclease/phosphatase family protein [Anaerolineae bacterium]|nr:endonuclease/exonuclease/phosphatase family protein [Anaerolineae bacterium]